MASVLDIRKVTVGTLRTHNKNRIFNSVNYGADNFNNNEYWTNNMTDSNGNPLNKKFTLRDILLYLMIVSLWGINLFGIQLNGGTKNDNYITKTELKQDQDKQTAQIEKMLLEFAEKIGAERKVDMKDLKEDIIRYLRRKN